MKPQARTITYSFYKGKGPDLAVILPGAGLTKHTHDQFIHLLRKRMDVLFITSGYFGLTPVNKRDNVQRFSRSDFVINLHTLLEKFKYRHLYLLTSSIGTIQGLAYSIKYPRDVDQLLLASPPIGTPIINAVMVVLTHLFLATNPSRAFAYFIKVLKCLPKAKKIAPFMIRTEITIGAESYLLCLKEIALFVATNRQKIASLYRSRAIVMGGTNDPIFLHACDMNLARSAKYFKIIPGRHALFVENPEEVIRHLELTSA